MPKRTCSVGIVSGRPHVRKSPVSEPSGRRAPRRQAFFDPRLLESDLRDMGFGHVEDNGPEEINERYFKNRMDGLRVGSLSHLMIARV